MKKHFYLLIVLALSVSLFSCSRDLSPEDSNTIQDKEEFGTKADSEFYDHFREALPANVADDSPALADRQLYKLVMNAVLADWFVKREYGNGDIYNAIYQTWNMGYGELTRAALAEEIDQATLDEMVRELEAKLASSPATRSGANPYMAYGEAFYNIMFFFKGSFNQDGYNNLLDSAKRMLVKTYVQAETSVTLGNIDPELDSVLLKLNNIFNNFDYSIRNTMNFVRRTYFGNNQTELEIMRIWLPVFLSDKSTYEQKAAYFQQLTDLCQSTIVTSEWTEPGQVERFLKAMAVGLQSARIWDMKYNFSVSPEAVTNVISTGTTITLSVNTNCSDWSYTLPGFIQEVSNNGIDYMFSVGQNPNILDRTGIIYFTYFNGAENITVEVPVTQKGREVSFTLSPAYMNDIDYRGTSNKRISISTNSVVPWTWTYTKPDFVTVRSSDANSITIDIPQNTAAVKREGTMNFVFTVGTDIRTVQIPLLQNPAPTSFSATHPYASYNGDGDIVMVTVTTNIHNYVTTLSTAGRF